MDKTVDASFVENDINDFCRLCGNVSQGNLVPIFGSECIPELSSKIDKYLPIKIKQDDILPTKICHSCATEILNWDVFCCRCVSTEQQFQMVLLKETEYQEFVLDDIDDVEEVKNSLEHVLQKLVEDQEFVPDDIYADVGENQVDDENVPLKSPSCPPMASGLNLDNKSKNVTKICGEDDQKKTGESQLELEYLKETIEDEQIEVEKDKDKTYDLHDNPSVNDTYSYSERNSANGYTSEPYNEKDEYLTDIEKKNLIFKGCAKEICLYCDELLEVDDMKEHLKNEHCDLIFHCDVCHQYKPRTELIAHMTMHAVGTGTFENTKREESIQTEVSKNNNVTKARKYYCEECRKIYKDVQGLKYHIKTFHEQIREYQCGVCGKDFPSERCVRNHINSIHDQEKTHECRVCKKLFKTDSTLYTHLKTHSDKYPFSCSVCEKKFRFKHHLYNHEKIHENVKSFKCQVCEKTFVLKDNLSKHMKTHTSDLKFDCKICGVKMKQRRYIAEHMKRVHSL